MYQERIRPLLFKYLSPEKAHRLTIWLMSHIGPYSADFLRKFTLVSTRTLRFEYKGLEFPNRLGISAGWDKNGEAILGLGALGMGFAEIGTVTPLKQKPLAKNCIYRAVEEEALVNRMGFNNIGAIHVAANLIGTPEPNIPIMVSFGKGRSTPVEEAADEYAYLLRVFYTLADMFAINLSSPNTKHLRDLLGALYLDGLLEKVMSMARILSEELEEPSSKPIFVKISPDSSDDELKHTLDVCENRRVDGLIVTNTSTKIKLVDSSPFEGGISGRPLFDLALHKVEYVKSQLPQMVVIGSGGISEPDDAIAMMQAGADLLQLLTAMIYKGPMIFRTINRELGKMLFCPD